MEKPSLSPVSGRSTRVDWQRVAARLAEGRSTAEVAQEVGCSRQHVWDILRKSRLARRALDDAESEVGTNANLRLRGLRPKLADALARELDKGNVRVMLWLAERLRVADELRARGISLHVGSDPLKGSSLDGNFPADALDALAESIASELTVRSAT
jgi:DNA invertase Pin-like site-specific DNA recombinase